MSPENVALETAHVIIATVEASHKFKAVALTEMHEGVYRVVHEPVKVAYTTLVTWVADAGGMVTMVGVSVEYGECYLVLEADRAL